MYVNERDQINYHGFLKALREMNKVPQEAVSKGICTVSGMNRFENGNRLAEKLMRDRLTARLGISGEKYEDYLQPKEYVKWEHRLRIVKYIEERKLSKAKAALCDYEALEGLNRINDQFVEAMRFTIMSLEGAPEEELLACIKKAVKYTVSNVNKALAGEHLLADQEINLIAELMRLTPPKKTIRDVNAWRISEYEKLITYMENSCWEKLQKAKVYPKIAFYICQLLLEGELDEAACRRGLELCHNAIELLRDTSRLYYFIELTERRRELANRLMTFDISSLEKDELEVMLKDNNAWEKVFKDLYEEYKVEPYMSDFCYLYYETECHNMVEVIETRRKMLNLSRVKLGEGICTERTIVRFEREGVNPSVDLVRLLFDKMGLCAEYRRARVITNDVEALMLSIEVTRNMNNRRFDEWESSLSKLSEKLALNILQNKQEIKRSEAWLKFLTRRCVTKEFVESSQVALGYTLPIDALLNEKHKYFTRSEIRCMFDIAIYPQGEISDICYKVLMDKYGNIASKKNIKVGELCMIEMVTEGLANHLGNIGEYDKSIAISKKMLKECLTYRKSEFLVMNQYNIHWNYRECHKQNTANKLNDDNSTIYRCFLISKLLRQKKNIAFFQTKLDM